MGAFTTLQRDPDARPEQQERLTLGEQVAATQVQRKHEPDDQGRCFGQTRVVLASPPNAARQKVGLRVDPSLSNLLKMFWQVLIVSNRTPFRFI